MDQYSRIGAYLKTLRESKKMSQEETAQQLNLSTRTLQRYESGEINALDKLISLADYYEVSLSELVTGERSNENIACGDKEKRLASFADEVAKKNMFRVYGLGFALTLLLCAIVISIQFICNGKYSPETMIIVLGTTWARFTSARVISQRLVVASLRHWISSLTTLTLTSTQVWQHWQTLIWQRQRSTSVRQQAPRVT